MDMVTSTLGDFGVLTTRHKDAEDWEKNFCVMYNPLFKNLSHEASPQSALKIVDLSDSYGCEITDYPTDVNGAIVIVARGNCSFAEKGEHAQSAGAIDVVIASSSLLIPGGRNESDYKYINISLSSLLLSDLTLFKHYGGAGSQVGSVYAPQMGKFDANMIVIFLIAVSLVVIGAFWSGTARQKKYEEMLRKKEQKNRVRVNGEGANNDIDDNDDTKNKDEDEDSVDISFCALLIGFVLICGFLLLLYFFYKYLVFVVIVLFCLAGSMGMYYCLKPFLHKVCTWEGKLPENRLPFFKHRQLYKDIILYLLCLGLAIFWGVMRHEPYAWVIQDILGYAFCLNVMRTVFLPNMKICTIMLCLLFLYDIFFVFISPLFTKDGESIMVKVATGGSSGGGGGAAGGGGGSSTVETLPMVFTMPRLTRGPMSACHLPYSLLGFGDIIIPGLLLSHNHAFDLRVKTRRVYYIATCIGYAVGLIITYIALAFMETGQPALLYLVPCTLIPTFLIGLYRREVKALWSGEIKAPTSAEIQEQEPEPDIENSKNTVDSSASDQSSSSIENDTRSLLKKDERNKNYT
ncbi:SPP2B-like protein [Mya arenaria]|uniref:SPP2B-like protein n=1 Tax=Mya arenaria TaxID=6604 RepID=A0ABY7D8E4_MYAAR|nr:SPP2B-like protein [Mya arenaria]